MSIACLEKAMNNLSNIPLILSNFEVSDVRKLRRCHQLQVKLLSVAKTDLNIRLKFICLNFKVQNKVFLQDAVEFLKPQGNLSNTS